MKLFGIICLIFISLFGLSVGIDVISGFSFRTSVMNIINPFRLNLPIEIIIFIIFLTYYITREVAKQK